MTEIGEDERRKRALKLYSDVPCTWLFAFVEYLADEIKVDRDSLLMSAMRLYDKLERGE